MISICTILRKLFNTFSTALWYKLMHLILVMCVIYKLYKLNSTVRRDVCVREVRCETTKQGRFCHSFISINIVYIDCYGAEDETCMRF